jgi:hypothetical protein
MTRIKITYIALDYESNKPIISADSFQNLKLALDDYCGADERNTGRYIGFKPYITKYPDDYEGDFEYECCKNGHDWSEIYVDKFKVYCVEFYPETKIEL